MKYIFPEKYQDIIVVEIRFIWYRLDSSFIGIDTRQVEIASTWNTVHEKRSNVIVHRYFEYLSRSRWKRTREGKRDRYKLETRL